MEGKTKSALGMAYRLARKSSAPAEKMSQGGTCYACGGEVRPELKEDTLEDKPDMELMSQGGQVEDFSEDFDDDSDDLVDSPEVFGKTGFGDVENEEEGDDASKNNNFLRAYMIHRKARG